MKKLLLILAFLILSGYGCSSVFTKNRGLYDYDEDSVCVKIMFGVNYKANEFETGTDMMYTIRDSTNAVKNSSEVFMYIDLNHGAYLSYLNEINRIKSIETKQTDTSFIISFSIIKDSKIVDKFDIISKFQINEYIQTSYNIMGHYYIPERFKYWYYKEK